MVATRISTVSQKRAAPTGRARSGRVYTVTYRAVNPSYPAIFTTVVATVLVPHDMHGDDGKGKNGKDRDDRDRNDSHEDRDHGGDHDRGRD